MIYWGKIKNKWFTTNEDYNELFGKIDEILELDGNYIQVLETKCYFLFEQFGDAVVDANDDYIIDDESRIKTNRISEEILNISEGINIKEKYKIYKRLNYIMI